MTFSIPETCIATYSSILEKQCGPEMCADELHGTRAAALEPSFSKASVYHLEPSIQSVVDQLVARLRRVQGTGSYVNMVDVFNSLIRDVISQHAFACPFGIMQSPDFALHWHQSMMTASETFHVFKHFGWLEPMMRRMPPSFSKWASPKLSTLLGLQDVCLHLCALGRCFTDERKTVRA